MNRIAKLAGAGLRLAFCMALAWSLKAQAQEQVTVQFSTVVQQPPPNAVSPCYYPKNVHAVWIENASGGFVRTAGRWANARKASIKTWYAKAGTSDADNISGATQDNQGTYSATWDMKPRGGSTNVADGNYKINLQMTWWDKSAAAYTSYTLSYSLKKDGNGFTLRPPDQLDAGGYGYKNIAITYTGRNAPAPNITLSPNPLAFGTKPVGSQSDMTFDITNPGLTDLQVTTLTLAGADQGAYSIIAPPPTPLVIGPGYKQSVTVRFAPGAAQSYTNASLVVTSNAPGKTTMNLALSGTGVLIRPDITLTPTALDYGTLKVGTSSTLSFDIANPGNGDLQISAITLDGADSAFYAMLAPPAMPLTIAPGGKRTITVRFAPDDERSYNAAQLTILSNAPGKSSVAETLRGAGRIPLPDITLSPTRLDYGQRATGASTLMTFDINNPGEGALQVTSLTLAGPDQAGYEFLNPPMPPYTLASGGKMTFAVSFLPEFGQTYNNAFVSVLSNAPGKALTTVTLTGEGLAPNIKLSATALAFPATAVASSYTLPLTISNQGASALHLSAVRIGGLDKNAFRMTAPAQTSLAPGGSVGMTVSFAPLSGQEFRHAQLTLGNDDPTQRVATVSLSGVGVRAALGSLGTARPIAGPGNAVAMLGSTTACVGQGATLTIYNITDPAHPVRLGQARLPGAIRKLCVSGGVAYAALGSAGVAIVSVNNASSPRLLATLDTPGDALDLALTGATLCVADGVGGLQLISVASPSAPLRVGAYATQGPARSVAAAGSLAYVVDEAKGVRVVSLSAPTSPTQVGLYAAPLGEAVAASGQKVYLATRLRELHVIDVTTPAAPVANAVQPTSCTAVALTVYGSNACLAGGSGGLEIINLAAAPPASYGAVPVVGEARSVAVQGTTALVAAGAGGLRLLNVGAPAAPVEVSADALAAEATGVSNDDALGAVADGSGGLQLVNLNALGMASLSGVIGSLGEARAVVTSGTIAYVAAGGAGLKIVSIAKPSAPTVLATFKTDGYANSVAVRGATALVADGLKVYRVGVANPAQPVLLGAWTSDGYAFGVAIDGTTGYVANGGSGLRTLDLSGASGLPRLGGATASGVAYGVAAAGGYAYVAAGGSGLQVFNVAAPATPSLLTRFDTPGTAMGAALRGKKLYLADGEGGLEAIDVSQPGSPRLDAKTTAPLRAWSVAAQGYRLIIGDQLGGPLYFTFASAADAWRGYE